MYRGDYGSKAVTNSQVEAQVSQTGSMAESGAEACCSARSVTHTDLATLLEASGYPIDASIKVVREHERLPWSTERTVTR